MDAQFAGLGFAPGVVRGARAFSVDDIGRLAGVVFREAYWMPGVNTAECLKGTAHDPFNWRRFPNFFLPAPEQPHSFEICHCGFYGYYDGSNDYAPRGNALVSGVIEGWGETLIGTRGFRCSKARIVALTIHQDTPPRIAAQIRDHYWDAPLFPTFEAMVTEFTPDKGEQ